MDDGIVISLIKCERQASFIGTSRMPVDIAESVMWVDMKFIQVRIEHSMKE